MRQPAHQGFIVKENDRESGLGDFGVRKYECESGRFLSVDALWEKATASSPYAYAAANPALAIDPNGMEWFKVEGSWQFVEGKSEVEFTEVDEDGSVSARKIRGTKQLLLFNGMTLTWLRSDGSTMTWVAESGPPNTEITADATMKKDGPIPEGTYELDPRDIESIRELPLWKRLLAPFGATSWPGGTSSWGINRVPILPQDDNRGERTGGYFIHGGQALGSRGCIDLGAGAQSFFDVFAGSGEMISLEVDYGH